MRNSTRPRLVGHRGAPRLERENTVASILRAVDLGADAVEIDVRTTSDGSSVVLHDERLDRLWRVDRRVRDLSAADLDWVTGHGVPSLVDVLGLAAERGIRLVIDQTGPEDAAAAAHLVAELAGSGSELPRIDWCGAPDGIAVVRAALPTARIQLNWYESTAPTAAMLAGLAPVALNLEHPLADARLVAAVHDLGLEVACWTVDDTDEALRLAALGVDAITTNDLAALRAALG